jgi:hypothetical protein
VDEKYFWEFVWAVDRKNAGRDAGATGSILSVGAVREEETKRRQGIDLQVICRNSGLN